MTIWDIYQSVLRLMNRDVRGSALRIPDFNIYADIANRVLFNSKFGLPEEYQPDNPKPRNAWQVTAKSTDDLGVFWATEELVPQNNLVKRPTDYLAHSSVLGVYSKSGNKTYSDPEVLDDDRFTSRLSSRLKGPTKALPIMRFIGDSIEIHPNITIKLDYLRKPQTPFLDYTILNNVSVYLPSGLLHDGTVLPIGTPSRTVESEWPWQVEGELVNLIISMASRQLVDQVNIQSTESIKQRGK